jgi:hypothetical protein
MSHLPFEIKTLDYDQPQARLSRGDQVRIEHVEGKDLYTTDGTFLCEIDGMYQIKFKTKFGSEQISLFGKDDIFAQINSDRISYVVNYPEFNSAIVHLDNTDQCHLIDLNNPGVIKYKFCLEGQDGRNYMISPQHLLYLPRYVGDYGHGFITDMSDSTLNVELKPTHDTLNFVKNNIRSKSSSYVIRGNHLYLTNGTRILVFDIKTGHEINHFDLVVDKHDYTDNSIIQMNGRIFTNTKTQLFEVTEFGLNEIQMPKPERPIYSGQRLSGITILHSGNKILIENPYYGSMDNLQEIVFPEDQVLNLLEVLEEGRQNFKNHVLKFVKNGLATLREKYPSLKIIFTNKDIKEIITNMDFEKPFNGTVRVCIPRYVFEYPVREYKLFLGSEFLGGLSHEATRKRIGKIDESGCGYCDYATQILFEDHNYNSITKEILVKHVLNQTLVNMRKQILKAIKFENIDGLSLDFNDFLTFDGDSFERKDYSKITLEDGRIVQSEYVTLRDKFEASVEGRYINIDFEGNQIRVPKTKYSIEEEDMTYDQAIKLDNIRGPGGSNKVSPSKSNFITMACDKFSEAKRYEEQRVNFLVWKEDFCTIKIPLSFSPKYGMQPGFGRWCNNCYIIYDSRYVRIVRILL